LFERSGDGGEIAILKRFVKPIAVFLPLNITSASYRLMRDMSASADYTDRLPGPLLLLTTPSKKQTPSEHRG
jgi:hypothetical protein